MPDDVALLVAAAAAKGFKVFECAECAKAVRQALTAAGHHGQEIELRGKRKKKYMICLSYNDGQAAISQNGRHVGIRVGDTVFDNLHPDGLSYDAWLSDFEAVGGIAVYRVDSF